MDIQQQTKEIETVYTKHRIKMKEKKKRNERPQTKNKERDEITKLYTYI